MNDRQKMILIDLLKCNDYESSAVFSKKYGVSTKTILSDLVVLDDEIMSKNMTIVRKPRKGIKVDANKKDKELYLNYLLYQSNGYKLDFKDRQAYYIKTLFLKSRKITILDLSLELYLSEASVRRDLEKLAKLLQNFSISLKHVAGDIYAIGDEVNIRRFLRNYIIENSDLTKEEIFFIRKEFDKVDALIDTCLSEYAYTIPGQFKKYLTVELLVCQNRFLLGYPVTQEKKEECGDVRQYEVYLLALNLLSQVLDLPVEMLVDLEVRQIARTILSIGYQQYESIDASFHDVTLQLIDKVADLAGVNLQRDRNLVRMVENHIRPMIYRLKNGIYIKNQTTEEIKRQYSVIYNIVWMASQVIVEKFDVEFTDSEIAFLSIYFEIAIEKIQKKLLIYVVCPHGLATSELIVNSLKKIVSDYDVIERIEMSDLKNEVIKKSDILISSVILDLPDEDYILVSPVLTNNEIKKIQTVYFELTNGSKHIPLVTGSSSTIAGILQELIDTSVFLQVDCKNKDEVIAYLVSKSKRDNQNDYKFEKSIHKREKMGSTSIYTGIALPHADPNYVNHSEIIFMTLKRPIIWGENLVKVIMLIALKPNKEEQLKDALIQVYSKIDNENYIHKLFTSETKEIFMENLM